MQDSVQVVVRCAGERTADLALELARSQVSDHSTVVAISEAPFESALRRSYEIGATSGRKWTVVLDADVLLRKGAIHDLIVAAEAMPEHFFHLQGRIYDKVTGMYRPAGHRIYRTDLIEVALQHIPPDGTHLRPEYLTICKMGELGFPSRYVGIVTGLHDFEQYYRDLYCKALLHSAKHRSWLGSMASHCIEHRDEDSDYQIVLKGLWDGLTAERAITVDARCFADQALAAIESIGLREKQPLLELSETSVYAMMEKVMRRSPPGQLELTDFPTKVLPWGDKIRKRFARKGVLKGGVAVLGAALRTVGRRLDG